jgi:hypothetical protein
MTTEIRNLTDLANTIGCYDSVEAIGKALFKGTECGIVFDGGHDYIAVSGYAEGADAECLRHVLKYPFTTKLFWATVQRADAEGVKMWYGWYDDDEDDVIEDDNRARCRDINEVLIPQGMTRRDYE